MTTTSGKPRLGWIGLDAPVEALAAVGLPVRMEADPATPSPLASPFGEGGGHPAMRATAGRVLAEAESLRHVVFGSTPVTGVWLYNFFLTLERGRGAPPLPPLDLVNISHEQRPSAAALNRQSIDRLVRGLMAPPDALRAAIRERNAVRGMQRRIETLRHGASPRLPGSVARRLLDLADEMTAADYLALAEEKVRDARKAAPINLAPVIYSGPGSPSLEFYAALEGQGLSVVADDADFGSRAIGPDVDETLDPIEALAERYARRSPAPAGWSTQCRVDWLTHLAANRGAQAVVFDLPAWAHPPAWDYPAERRALESMGVGCILVPDAGPQEAAQFVAQTFRTFQAGRQAHV